MDKQSLTATTAARRAAQPLCSYGCNLKLCEGVNDNGIQNSNIEDVKNLFSNVDNKTEKYDDDVNMDIIDASAKRCDKMMIEKVNVFDRIIYLLLIFCMIG